MITQHKTLRLVGPYTAIATSGEFKKQKPGYSSQSEASTGTSSIGSTSASSSIQLQVPLELSPIPTSLLRVLDDTRYPHSDPHVEAHVRRSLTETLNAVIHSAKDMHHYRHDDDSSSRSYSTTKSSAYSSSGGYGSSRVSSRSATLSVGSTSTQRTRTESSQAPLSFTRRSEMDSCTISLNSLEHSDTSISSRETPAMVARYPYVASSMDQSNAMSMLALPQNPITIQQPETTQPFTLGIHNSNSTQLQPEMMPLYRSTGLKLDQEGPPSTSKLSSESSRASPAGSSRSSSSRRSRKSEPSKRVSASPQSLALSESTLPATVHKYSESTDSRQPPNDIEMTMASFNVTAITQNTPARQSEASISSKGPDTTSSSTYSTPSVMTQLTGSQISKAEVMKEAANIIAFEKRKVREQESFKNIIRAAETTQQQQQQQQQPQLTDNDQRSDSQRTQENRSKLDSVNSTSNAELTTESDQKHLKDTKSKRNRRSTKSRSSTQKHRTIDSENHNISEDSIPLTSRSKTASTIDPSRLASTPRSVLRTNETNSSSHSVSGPVSSTVTATGAVTDEVHPDEKSLSQHIEYLEAVKKVVATILNNQSPPLDNAPTRLSDTPKSVPTAQSNQSIYKSSLLSDTAAISSASWTQNENIVAATSNSEQLMESGNENRDDYNMLHTSLAQDMEMRFLRSKLDSMVKEMDKAVISVGQSLSTRFGSIQTMLHVEAQTTLEPDTTGSPTVISIASQSTATANISPIAVAIQTADVEVNNSRPQQQKELRSSLVQTDDIDMIARAIDPRISTVGLAADVGADVFRDAGLCSNSESSLSLSTDKTESSNNDVEIRQVNRDAILERTNTWEKQRAILQHIRELKRQGTSSPVQHSESQPIKTGTEIPKGVRQLSTSSITAIRHSPISPTFRQHNTRYSAAAVGSSSSSEVAPVETVSNGPFLTRTAGSQTIGRGAQPIEMSSAAPARRLHYEDNQLREPVDDRNTNSEASSPEVNIVNIQRRKISNENLEFVRSSTATLRNSITGDLAHHALFQQLQPQPQPQLQPQPQQQQQQYATLGYRGSSHQISLHSAYLLHDQSRRQTSNFNATDRQQSDMDDTANDSSSSASTCINSDASSLDIKLLKKQQRNLRRSIEDTARLLSLCTQRKQATSMVRATVEGSSSQTTLRPKSSSDSAGIVGKFRDELLRIDKSLWS